MSGEQANPGSEQDKSNGFWGRFKRMSHELSGRPTQPASSRVPTEKPLETLPHWAEKKADVNSINLYELPINWQALADLSKGVNQIRDNHVEASDIVGLKPPPEVYPALSMVASVIANKRNSEIPVILPTHADVEAMKPWLAKVDKFIAGFGSENWARKFRSYIEKKGGEAVRDMGMKVSSFADMVGSINNPREQFLKELTLVYQHLQKPETRTASTFLFFEDEEIIPIEDKICSFLGNLKYRAGNGVPEDEFSWLNDSEDFPIITKLFPKLKFPPASLDTGTASIAGAELMQGIEIFLKQRGIKGIGPAPSSRELNLFDPGSWGRGLAEWFASEKLEKVKNGLPLLLTLAHKTLPANGPAFADKIYDIAENICILKEKGHAPEEIASNIFRKP